MNAMRRQFLKAAGMTGLGALLAAQTDSVLGQTRDPCAACLGSAPQSQPDAVRGRGIGLHIGINRNDPTTYGRIQPLSGCHRDAEAMARVAANAGILPGNIRILRDEEATVDAVVKQIEQAAAALQSGDLFMLTYAGHGSQIHDQTPTDEPDRQDETWCLYDYQLRDDSMYTLWKRFREGVRILMVNDSCHNGTMARVMAALLESLPEEAAARGNGASLRSILDPEGAYRGGGGARARGRRARAASPDEPITDTGAIRALPDFNEDGESIREDAFERQRARIAEWDDYIRSSDRSSDDEVRASVILLAGCQDNQVCLDGSRNGLFTSKLLRAFSDWRPGTGGYERFVMSIASLMPPTQTPNYYVVGRKNVAFEQQNPFTV